MVQTHNLLFIAIGFIVGITLWLVFMFRNKVGKISNKQLIPFIFAVGLACRIVFAIGTPDFYAPDEQSHFNYVRFLSEHRSFPIQINKTGAATNDWEFYQPPLYYISQVPIYVLSTTIFKDDYYVIRALRFTSIFFWIGNVWLSLQFLRILKIDNEFLQIVVIGMVCLLPTYTFLSSMINNDNLVLCIGGLLLCSIARRELALHSAIVTGTLLGFALLTKLTAIVYCPAIILLVAFQAIREPKNRHTAINYLLVVVIVSVLIFLPWVIRNLYIYGSITAENVANVPYTWPTMAKAFTRILKCLSRSFWSVSGISNDVYSYFPIVGMLVSVLALSGLIYIVLSREKRISVFYRELDGRFLIAMGLSIMINLLLVLRFGILYAQGQGRFLFPLLFPISLFIGIGLRQYWIKNFSIYIVSLFSIYAVTFTLFSLGSFPRI